MTAKYTLSPKRCIRPFPLLGVSFLILQKSIVHDVSWYVRAGITPFEHVFETTRIADRYLHASSSSEIAFVLVEKLLSRLSLKIIPVSDYLSVRCAHPTGAALPTSTGASTVLFLPLSHFPAAALYSTLRA